MRRRSFLATAAGLGAAALAGCGHGAATTFYTLDPVAPSAVPASTSAPAYAPVPVRVDAVHVPAVLDRPELVRPVGTNGVQVRDFDRWAAPLGELARRALTQDLAARLPQGSVVFPDSPKPPGARGIVVDLLAITPGADTTTLDASWTLLPAVRGGAVLRQRSVRLTTPPAAGPGGQAHDLSALLAQLADRIAADLSAPSAGASAP